MLTVNNEQAVENPLLATWQEPEEEVNKLLLRKVSGRDRNVKG